MRLSKCAPRMLAASAVLCGVWAAEPALAQSSAALTVSSFAPPAAISVGKTGEYTATINNAGPSTARGVTAKMTAPAGLDVTAVDAACTTTDPAAIPAAGAPVVTCTLADIPDGGKAAVTFTVSIPLPNPLPTDPSACPSAPVPDATVAVSATNAATVTRNASLDAVTADDPPVPAPGDLPVVNPYADLGIDVQGPPTAKVGDVVTYAVIVTNNGPCTAQNVVVDNSGAAAGLIFQSGEGTCTDTSATCKLGNLLAGSPPVTFKSTFKVDSLPSNLQSTNNPYPVAVSSDTDDPNPDNDSSTARALTQTSSSGCSSGGPAGLATVALFLVSGLAIRRRRA
jgi:uncharacterized repeat protein (TIGR01451 family)/uncharacterized protein (TIGR03382 family)